MKRSNDEIYIEETKRKEIKLTTYQAVIITLDETIGSKLLYRKFKYQTSELQLFLQHVPILYWYPLDIIGGNIKKLDTCIFNAAMRNPFQQCSTVQMIKSMVELDIFQLKPHIKIDEIIEPTRQKAAKLLKGLLDDELFMLQALGEYKKGGDYSNPIKFASNRLKDEEKFMLKAIKLNGDSIKYASYRLRNTEQFMSKEQPQSSLDSSSKATNNEILYSLEYSSSTIRDDEQAVLTAIKYDYSQLKYASDRLRDNEEIVLEAVKHSVYALCCASDRLTDDEQFMLRAVKVNGHTLPQVSDRLKENKNIILEAIKQNGNALKYAPNRFADNEEIVLEAVKQSFYTLAYVSQRLKDDETIVLQAVKYNGRALQHASQRLRDSEAIVLQAVKDNGRTLEFASQRLRDNEKIVLEAVKETGYAFEYASNRLRDDERFVLEAVKHDGPALKYAPDRLRNDFNFANQIFKCCTSLNIFEHFGEEFRNIEFIYYFIENYQSRFHELMRNINRNELENVTISATEIIGKIFIDDA